MSIDPRALQASLASLSARPSASGEPGDLLHQVVLSANGIFTVTGTGLMIIDQDQVLRYVAASDAAGRALELGQEQAGEGPCVDAFVYGTVVTTQDLRADSRYLRLRPLLAEAPVVAVLGVPVRLMGTVVAALNAYVDRPRGWLPEEVRALECFAEVVEQLLASTLALHRSSALAGQLQHALDYRVVIERAVGFLMAREDLDAVRAFELLRTAARSSRRPVVEVASSLLRGDAEPPG